MIQYRELCPQEVCTDYFIPSRAARKLQNAGEKKKMGG